MRARGFVKRCVDEIRGNPLADDPAVELDAVD
jgi:hypothetical protein